MVSDTAYLRETLRMFRRRPVLYYAIAATPFLVMVLILFLAGHAIRPALATPGHTSSSNLFEMLGSMGWATRVGVILLFLSSVSAEHAIGASGIALLTWEDCEGRELTTLDMAATTCRRLLPLMVLGFIVGVGALAGSFLFVLPGLAFLALAGFAIPAATVENLGPLRALKRSFRLTRGRIIELTLIYLLAALVFAGLRILLNLLPPTLLWSLTLHLLLIFLLMFTLDVFLCILLTLLYRQARIEREAAQASSV